MTTSHRRYRSAPHHPDVKHSYEVPLAPGDEHLPAVNRKPVPVRDHPSTNDVDIIAEVRARITSSAEKNTALLIAMRDTEAAAKEHAVRKVHIEKLKEELERQSTVLRDIDQMLLALRAGRMESYRRYWVKIKTFVRSLKRGPGHTKMEDQATEGQGDSAEKDQKYFESLAMKSKAERREAELKSEIEKSERDEEALAPKLETHQRSHIALDDLYERIFAGPTPGFPHEDAAETAFQSALERHEEQKELVRSRRRAILFIQRAQQSRSYGAIHINNAKTAARASLFDFGAGSVKTDLLTVEHYATVTASDLEKAALQLAPLTEAQHRSLQEVHDTLRACALPYLRARTLDKEALLSATEKSAATWELMRGQLEKLVGMAKEREKIARDGIKVTALKLEETRGALQQVRQEVFEEVVGFGEAPPSYNNCCPREGWYEQTCDAQVAAETVEDEPLQERRESVGDDEQEGGEVGNQSGTAHA